MSDQDYMVQGMQEAADKHDPAAMLAKYHRERDQVAPYIPPARITDQAPDTGALTPSQIRGLKMIGITGTLACGWAGFLTACAAGAMNTVFQVGACVGILLFFLSAMSGSKESVSRAAMYGEQPEKELISNTQMMASIWKIEFYIL